MEKIHIQLKEGQKVFFTSDLHIGHRNVLRFCNRPFLDEKDMLKGLVENWNSVVGEEDIVFDLGDMFWWESRHEIKKVINKLNGKIYKIPGNHDMDVKRLYELCDPEKVTVCESIVAVYLEGLTKEESWENRKVQEIWLCHMPLATWPHWEFTIQLFGHIHSGPLAENAVDVVGKDLLLNKSQYDVGVDNNDFKPIEIREIFEKLRKRKAQTERYRTEMKLASQNFYWEEERDKDFLQ